ncbi:MAG: carboxypeptidase regulatory-like domain-containing protein [Bacteroidetes bacterium]|nr:carboxypeptidase regulatory-like domain-containing protein [Bacteroidota bacterium]
MKRSLVTFCMFVTAVIISLTIYSCEKLDELTGATKPGKISGMVRDSISNIGLAGVSISTLPPTNTAETDSNGVFLLEEIDKGDYVIRFSRNEYLSKSMDINVVAEKSTVIQVVLAPVALPTGSIQGAVTNSVDARPVAGATVTTEPVTVTVTTDTLGRFSIPQIPVRSYSVRVAAAGYQQGSAAVQVAAGQTAPASIALVPLQTSQTGTIKGTITHSVSGTPIADATVITKPATTSVNSDVNGNFQLSNVLAGTYTIEVSKIGYNQAASTPVVLSANSTQTVNFTMAPSGTGIGSVKVTVLAIYQGVQIPFPYATLTLIPGNIVQTTDTTGTAYFTAVPFGAYTLRCEHTALITTEQSVTVSASQQISVTITPQLAPAKTGSVQGKVLNALTKGPIAAATVVFTTDGDRSVTTNSNGEFTADNVPVGKHSLTASVPGGGYASKTLETDVIGSQTTSVEFMLQPNVMTTVIAGKVLNALKLPEPGVLVELPDPALSSVTNAAGLFILKGNIPAGQHQLKVTKQGFTATSASASVSRYGDSVWIGEISISSSGGPGTITIGGKAVSIVSMKGVAGTTVTTLPATSIVSTGSDGVFTIPNVMAGTYGIDLSHSKYINYRVDGLTFPLSYELSVYMFYGKYTAAQTAFYPLVTTWQEWNKSYWGSAGQLQNYGTVPASNRFGISDHARQLSGAQYMMTTAIGDSAGAAGAVMISFWTKLEPTLSKLTPLVAWSNSAGTSGWSVAADNEAGKISLKVTANNTNGTAVSYDPVHENDLLGKWVMITVGFRRSPLGTYQAVLYLNGTKRLDQSLDLPNINLAANQLVVGRAKRGGEPFQFMSGTIDDIHLFRSFLSDAEIADLFNEE